MGSQSHMLQLLNDNITRPLYLALKCLLTCKYFKNAVFTCQMYRLQDVNHQYYHFEV